MRRNARRVTRAQLVAPVHHVQVISAELAQVLLDLAAELVRPGRGQPLARRVPARPDLGDDDQVVRVWRQRRVDQLVGRAQRGEVERGRVDVVDAEFDRAAQHRDGPAAVARDGVGGQRPAGLRQAHRAEAHPVDGQVAELPGARGGRGDRVRGHQMSSSRALATADWTWSRLPPLTGLGFPRRPARPAHLPGMAGQPPASARARRSRNSIWALVLRNSSAAHRASASWTAGSSRSSTPLRSLTAYRARRHW